MDILREILPMDLESTLGSELNIQNCRSCSSVVAEADQFCQSCGFPLKGTDAEQQIFIYRRGFKNIELNELNRKIKSAGTTLYVLSGIFLVFGLIYFFARPEDDLASAILITYGILAILFLLLGFWSKKKPVAAIISGLVLFVLLQIIAAIENPLTILQGIIIKVIIIGYLIKGMKSAFEAEKIKKQFSLD